MAINFSTIKLEVIDISIDANPGIFINQNGITFNKRVLEDLNYPQFVQYCVDATHKVFAIRFCKGNEVKATPFSKPRAEQTTTLTCNNKNLRDVIITMIPGFNNKNRYKVTGEFNVENRVVYFDMTTAQECNYRTGAANADAE